MRMFSDMSLRMFPGITTEVFLENCLDILAGIHAGFFQGISTRSPLGISEFSFTIPPGIPGVIHPHIELEILLRKNIYRYLQLVVQKLFVQFIQEFLGEFLLEPFINFLWIFLRNHPGRNITRYCF